MPAWADADPADYWDAADLYDRANARLYVSADFALPRDLDADDQVELVHAFAQELTADEQLPYTLAIHVSTRFDFVNPALHVEVAFRHGVVFAVENLLEAAHRFGHRDLLSLVTAKHRRHGEGLAQEALNLAGTQHRGLVLG